MINCNNYSFPSMNNGFDKKVLWLLAFCKVNAGSAVRRGSYVATLAVTKVFTSLVARFTRLAEILTVSLALPDFAPERLIMLTTRWK